MSSIPACQLNCLNGGYCTFISSDEPTLVDTFARGGLIQKCICTPGYSGISCENKVEECSTDMKCHNGLPCALDEKTGKHYCDCSYADLISTFAGKMCREPATSYCGQGDIKNRSFCTNGGLCEANIYRGVHLDESSNNYSTHKGCGCPPEFEGDHCEFLRGKGQVEESTEQNNQDESKTSTTEDVAIAAPATPAETATPVETEPASLDVDVAAIAATTVTPEPIELPVAPLNHAKESKESNSPVTTNQNVQAQAFTLHNKTPSIQEQPSSKVAPPDSDNTLLDLESVPKETIPFEPIRLSSSESTAETNQLGGPIIALISLTGVALIIGLISYRRMRKRNHRQRENHFVLGDNYKDETPIRVQVLSELEQPNELDEVLGLDAGSVEYEDDDEVFTERSLSDGSLEEIEDEFDESVQHLEEIELEYPTNEGDDEEGEFVGDYNPFSHIIGPLLRSDTGDGIV